LRRLITRPEQFAEWFNRVVPGAYRDITVEDVQDMTTCGLIRRYGEYMQLDIETVRAILQYEQLRQNRQIRDEIRDSEGIMHCRRCHAELPKAKARRGRPNEYCAKCQPFRGRERNRTWRTKLKAARN